jgi:hypothetical protein
LGLPESTGYPASAIFVGATADCPTTALSPVPTFRFLTILA